MITTVNYDLSLQLTCKLVNLSTTNTSSTNYANDTNYITINISAIREIRSH